MFLRSTYRAPSSGSPFLVIAIGFAVMSMSVGCASASRRVIEVPVEGAVSPASPTAYVFLSEVVDQRSFLFSALRAIRPAKLSWRAPRARRER